jgi:hypothetical protein
VLHYAASAKELSPLPALAVERRPTITVNARPGATDRPMSRQARLLKNSKERRCRRWDGLTKKEEIGRLTRYLLSEATQYVTGQTFFSATKRAPQN